MEMSWLRGELTDAQQGMNKRPEIIGEIVYALRTARYGGKLKGWTPP